MFKKYFLSWIPLQQKSPTISTTIKNSYNKKINCCTILKLVKETLFAADSFATKITNYFNKHHKCLQQKIHVFVTFLQTSSSFFLQIGLQQKITTNYNNNHK